MKHIELFESFKKYDFGSLDQIEIENYLLHWTDRGDMIVGDFGEPFFNPLLFTPNMGSKLTRLPNLFGGDRLNALSTSITFTVQIKQPYRVRNTSFDIPGYSTSIIKSRLQRLYNDYNVNIFVWVRDVDYMAEYISKSYVIIQPKTEETNEKYSHETIGYIESFFIELSDYKDAEYPITVSVYPRCVSKGKYYGYEVSVTYDLYDKYFMEKKIDMIKLRLKKDFNIRSSSVGKTGQYRTKVLQVDGTDRVSTVSDPIYIWSITISPKFEEIF